MPTRPLIRRTATAAVALVLTLGLAACSGSGADAGGASEAVYDADVSAPESAAVGDVAAEENGASTVVDREVVVTGYVSLAAADPAETSTDLVRLVEQAGGHVEQRQERPGSADDPGSASLTFRVPADRTSSAITALSDLGDVQDIEISSTDVTSQGQDLDARISALTTSTNRLTELLASAGSTNALLEVERELSTRQAELDSLVAQRDALSDQVAMSTIHVEINAPAEPLSAPRGGFTGGLATGWNALVATVQTVVLVLGVVLPWLALAGVGYVAYRWVRRRRRPAAPPSASGPESGGSEGPGDGTDGPDEPTASAPEREPELAR